MLKQILVATVLAMTLTISHALLRAASGVPLFGLSWVLHMGGALALYAAVFFIYSFILKYFDLSILYPTYTALSILGVFLVGIFYFGEHFTLQKVVGVVTIILGVGILAS